MDWYKTSGGEVVLQPGQKLIGFSMSKCVSDIILGYVKLEDVLALIASTRMTMKEQAMQGYWMVWEARAEEAGNLEGRRPRNC